VQKFWGARRAARAGRTGRDEAMTSAGSNRGTRKGRIPRVCFRNLIQGSITSLEKSFMGRIMFRLRILPERGSYGCAAQPYA